MQTNVHDRASHTCYDSTGCRLVSVPYPCMTARCALFGFSSPGAAVPGVACVLASACFAATQFYSVSEKAGSLLGLTAVWITVAGLLIADTWRIKAAEAGSKWEGEPLFPVKGEVATRFWFEK